MTAEIINGKLIAEKIAAELRDEVSQLRDQGVIPKLGVILVGEDPGSVVYVRNKENTAKKLNIEGDFRRLPAETTQEEVMKIIDQFNKDDKLHGFIVQLPLPKGYDTEMVLLSIDPNKDVDGFHPFNLGRLLAGAPGFVPCTPVGILEILQRSGVKTQGKNVVIVGRSNIVGKPLASLLLLKGEMGDATVTVCHQKTANLARVANQADILVAAMGRPRAITADMIKPGAVVIDVGINRVEGKLVGDVDFENAKEVASAITPVPGGVGPLTVIMLLKNVVQAARRSFESRKLS